MEGPIGIFDSGLGGLTVLKVLSTKFPQEDFCYLGDIARLPYGNKSPETIRRYGLQILDFLIAQKVKAIIIACNSASSVFLGEDTYKGVPLLNVIEPGALAALRISQDKKIAILGTSATIRSHAYLETIKKHNKEAIVREQSCPLLVPLVEEGIANHPITEAVVLHYLKQIKDEHFSTIILGCTHYPVIKDDIQRVLGPKIKLVESGEVLAEKIQELFRQNKLSESSLSQGNIRVCITDLTDHFEQLANDLMSPIGISSLERVVL